MKTKYLTIVFTFSLLAVLFISCRTKQSATKAGESVSALWTIEKAQQWGNNQPWLRGSDFIPSSAINQLEMWQSETFDRETIDRELGWAESIGMNCMRVYLHHVAWETDKEGFLRRMKEYLDISSKHGIGTIFVFFDDCWNSSYKPGKQPEPKKGIHNSGWIRDPGDLLFSDPGLLNVLEAYVKDVLTEFKDDSRVVIWDMYNEPGNSDYGNKSLPLLEKAFKWGRDVNPSQPLSCGVWNHKLKDLNKFQVTNSDIITYHNYSDAARHQMMIDTLKLYKRPLVCTEYMARRNNSLFSTIMPMLKEQNIGALNWGLVSGKTNTIYAWDTPIPDGSEPALWFHDIFRKDGTPYRQDEVDIIKKLTGAK
jgi:hypothetical protein